MELNNFIHVLGWTLVNSLWHALLIAILLGILLLLIKPKYSQIRVLLAFASLILVFAASVRTFADLSNSINNNELNKINNEALTSKLLFFYDLNSNTSNSQNISEGVFSHQILNTISSFANNNLEIIVILWFAGILLLSLRMFGGYLYLQKIKTKQLSKVDEKWENLLRTVSYKLRIKKVIYLYESAIVKFPTVIGFFKPIILMPIGILNSIPSDQIEMIFAHELAHIKRSDYLLNLIQSFLEIIYFFNPAVWFISKIIRNEREFACDDMAIETFGNKIILAKALISVQDKKFNEPAIALSAIGTKNSIFRRVQRMLNNNNTSINYPKKLGLSFLLVISIIIISVLACSTSYDSMNDNNNSNSSFVNSNNNQMINNNPELSENFSVQNIERAKNIEPSNKIEKIKAIKQNGNFNFHKDGINWSGIVKNGKVIELYKDGKRIPDNRISEFEDDILKTLKEIDESLEDLDIDLSEFKVSMQKLKEDMRDLKIDLDFDEITKNLNSEEFRKEMTELKKSLQEMKFEFNEQLREELNQTLKENKNIKLDIEHFKSEEFKKEMQNLKEELEKLKDIKIDIDQEELKESMRELKENMQNLKIDLSDLNIDLSSLKEDLQKLENFVNYLRNDLFQEGYLKDQDKDFEFNLDQYEAVFEGKKLPQNLHQKYLEKYEEYFGHKLKDEFKLRN
ncbi:MAG: M48 family metalloprotease [Ignavibacteriales bacterium]|nr:M48 family metalloprotease [Ignavibacteriales bacterium]